MLGVLVVDVPLLSSSSPWWESAGVLSLVGVAVGVGITAGKDWLIEQRRSGVEKTRAKEQMRQAARLVTLDFVQVAGQMANSIECGTYVADHRRAVGWDGGRLTLSGSLPDDDWYDVGAAADAMSRFYYALDVLSGQGVQIDESASEDLEALVHIVQDGISALHPYAVPTLEARRPYYKT